MNHPHSRIAALERARIDIAAKLTGRSFDDDTARSTAQAITDLLVAQHWRVPGTADSQPRPYQRERVQRADEDHARSTAERLRAELAASRSSRLEADATAEQARHEVEPNWSNRDA